MDRVSYIRRQQTLNKSSQRTVDGYRSRERDAGNVTIFQERRLGVVYRYVVHQWPSTGVG